MMAVFEQAHGRVICGVNNKTSRGSFGIWKEDWRVGRVFESLHSERFFGLKALQFLLFGV
jgi:hypothetical protein